jgi:hypothetical protein
LITPKMNAVGVKRRCVPSTALMAFSIGFITRPAFFVPAPRCPDGRRPNAPHYHARTAGMSIVSAQVTQKSRIRQIGLFCVARAILSAGWDRCQIGGSCPLFIRCVQQACPVEDRR